MTMPRYRSDNTQAADQIAATGDVQAHLVGSDAVAAEPDTRDGVRAIRGRVDGTPWLAVAIDGQARPEPRDVGQPRAEVDGHGRGARQVEIDGDVACEQLRFGDRGTQGALAVGVGTDAVALVGVDRCRPRCPR